MTEETKKQEQELLAMPFLIRIPVREDAGPTMGRFLLALKDKKIWANKCPSCGRMAIPPRSFCGRCLGVEMTEWIEMADEGTLEGIEICFFDFIQSNTGEVQKAPWAMGKIRLDGGALIEHFVWPPDPSKLKIGGRYKAVWNETRKGEFHDIVHFTAKEQE